MTKPELNVVDVEFMSREELREERVQLERRIGAIDKRAYMLDLEKSHEDHPCSCVRLNSEIGVFNYVTTQAKRRSAGFGTGYISDLLSADLDCPKCGGTGVPKEGS